MNASRIAARITDEELLESRLAARVAEALRWQADSLPQGVEERLRFAREQALTRARSARETALSGVSGGGAAILGRLGPWWPRLGALLPGLVLALGAILIIDRNEHEHVTVAAEIDAALLVDDLPPQAYTDPGFVAFLKLQQP